LDNELLQKLQSVELDILRDVDYYCSKHAIDYSLYAGTALGAVRHGGFIPWDDDVDISMTRAEFDRFCNAWIKEPMPGYYLESIPTDKQCGICHAKVRKDNTLFISEGERAGKGHHGVWVDVFPLDKVPNNKAIRDKKIACGRKLVLLARANANSSVDGLKKRLVRRLVRVLPKSVSVVMTRNAYQWLVVHADDGVEEGYEWHSMSTLENIDAMSFPEDMCGSYTKIQFCDYNFEVFSGYEEMLSRIYGDYMSLPPESERVCKHNPVEVRL
jgi:lipopolysaccharide cholinephosphotransferase